MQRASNFLEYVQEELKQLEKMYKADDLTEETEEIVLKRARNNVDQMKFFTEMVKYEHDRDKEIDLPRSLAHYQHAAALADPTAEKCYRLRRKRLRRRSSKSKSCSSSRRRRPTISTA